MCVPNRLIADRNEGGEAEDREEALRRRKKRYQNFPRCFQDCGLVPNGKKNAVKRSRGWSGVWGEYKECLLGVEAPASSTLSLYVGCGSSFRSRR